MLRKMLLKISTHTSHAGRDSISKVCLLARSIFLLTRPMRGATPCAPRRTHLVQNFYSHAPCGARPLSDRYHRITPEFLLTRPMRGATSLLAVRSIRHMNFYSHAPCGARREILTTEQINRAFLLTRPMRGATNNPFRKNKLK